MNSLKTHALLVEELRPLLAPLPMGDSSRVVIDLCLAEFGHMAEAELDRQDQEDEIRECLEDMKEAADRADWSEVVDQLTLLLPLFGMGPIGGRRPAVARQTAIYGDR